MKYSKDKYLLPDGSISVEQLEKDWFKDMEAYIFLLYAHRDKETALILAGILYKKFKLTSFIDFIVWKDSIDLLKK